MMKALVWTAPEQMEMQALPIPEPAADELLVKVAYAGICGSELGGYLGHNSLRVPPLVMGHEFAGTIAAIGPEVAADLQPGLAVTVNPLSCPEASAYVARGLDQLCPGRKLLGAHLPGAYAEYVAVPARSVLPLPAGLSLREGALTEPVGCAVRIGELAGPVAGRHCLIIGAGPIGLLTLQVLRLQEPASIHIADIAPERLAMGAALGGSPIDPRQQDVVTTIHQMTGGVGVGLAVDAVGSAVTRAQCVAATMAAGTVILSGLHEESSELPVADIIRREIKLLGSFAYSPANFAAAIDMLAAKKITLDPWIVEDDLAAGGVWFERLIQAPGNVAKVLLKP